MGRTWSSICPHLIFCKYQQVLISFGLVEVLPGEFVFLECQQPQASKRSTRKRRSTIANDYIVYFEGHEFDVGLEDDPIFLNETKLSVHFSKWPNAMMDELKSIKENDI